MGRYFINRLLAFIPVLFIVSLIVFSSIHLIPGDPIRAMYGPGFTLSEETLELTRHNLGLDQNLTTQYIRWIVRALSGDLGLSIRSKEPVLSSILQRAPATLFLAGASIFVAVLTALPLGVIAGVHQSSVFDRFVLGVARIIGLSTPGFALGIILILIFAVKLDWLPASGYTDPSKNLSMSLRYLILPAITQGAHLAGILVSSVRQGVVEEITSDYVRTARSKGLSEQSVVWGHVFRNAFISILPVMGWIIGYQLAGTVVVETLFSWPGIGRLAYQAITNRDFPMVQGIALVAALGFLIVNLFVDLLYPVIDPRIRMEVRADMPRAR